MSGYCIMDLPPGFADKIEEAFDILNCMHSYNFEAVELFLPNQVLTNMIISSGFSVYCAAVGVGHQSINDPVGLYNSGNRKTMRWIPNKQTRPQSLTIGLNFPKPNLFLGASSFVYEYIPAKEESQFYYYIPSMKAASGLCIKTNHDLSRANTPPVSELIKRFYMAVFCRSQFIYNRVTFAAIDPMWRFFRHGVVLTRTAVEETVETFSQLAERAVSVRFSDDKLDKEWAQDGVSIKFSPLVTERNSTVDPGQIPDSYQRIPLKDVSRLFTEKIREYDGQTQLLQQWFVEIVNKDKLSNDVLASFLAIMPLAGVLGEIAVFGGFLETVDISPQGDVFFLRIKIIGKILS